MRDLGAIVGAHLANAATTENLDVFYWRERNREVDFVVSAGKRLVALEVKNGLSADTLPGLAAFATHFKPHRSLLVGGDGVAIAEFLATPVYYWLDR